MSEECVCYNSGYVSELCSGEVIIRCPVCTGMEVHEPGSVIFVATVAEKTVLSKTSMKELVDGLRSREFRPNEQVTMWMVYTKDNFPPVLIGMCHKRKDKGNQLFTEWLRSVS